MRKLLFVCCLVLAALICSVQVNVKADGQRRYGNCYIARLGGSAASVLVPTPWDGFWRYTIIAQLGTNAADSAHVVLYLEDGDSTIIKFKQAYVASNVVTMPFYGPEIDGFRVQTYQNTTWIHVIVWK